MTVKDRLILVLEDQPEIGRLVCSALEQHGYRSELYQHAAGFLRRLRSMRPDLCLVDLGLPDEDGLSVVRTIRRDNPVPVIIITGRGGVTDRVLGLELGADDYVVKPFEPRELVARVNAVLRRARPDPEADSVASVDIARFAGWTFDYETHSLTNPNGEPTELSTAEARLLLAFVKAPNRILTRESLLGTKGTDDRSPFDRSIDVRISRLRQKIEPDPKSPQIIKTVYGTGYLFAARVEWVARTQ